MKQRVVVRQAGTGDTGAFLGLVDGLADYESLPRPDANARARLEADALAGRFHLLLAELSGEIVGYAAYFFTYSTFLARPTLYLEDLFVRKDSRGNGAGLALFSACAAVAVSESCGRMEWQVLDWNTPAREFYERLGARQLDEWLPCRLEGSALQSIGCKSGPRE